MHCAPLQQASFFASTSPDVFGFTNKMGWVPWGSFWGPQKPSISLFQQVQWWDLLMDKGSIVTDITEIVDTKRLTVEKGTHPEFPTPHPPGQSKILLDIFRWMQKNGSKNLWPGKISLCLFRSDRVTSPLSSHSFSCPSPSLLPRPTVAQTVHGSSPQPVRESTLCDEQMKKKKVVSSGTESRPLPFLARQCGSGYGKTA